MLAVLVLFGSLCGCVRRRLTIRSNPPGAHVYIDNYEIGSTPVSHNFIYYGERKIRLVKDGYETLTVKQCIPMPWYQIPPLDFVSENIIPGEIRDHRTITYQLTPQCEVPRDHLLGRAETLRNQVQGPRMVTPPPVMMPAESIQPGLISPGGVNAMPPVSTPAPPAWNAVPPSTYQPTSPSTVQPRPLQPGVANPYMGSPPPVGFGPRSTPPVQPGYTQPGYPQPGYPQPIYPPSGTGGRIVQPISPGAMGQ